MINEHYLAGMVKRHHTNASPDSQSIAHHSWGVAMILQFIAPDCSKNALLWALRHDVAERWVGDMPAHVKWEEPTLAAEHRIAEERVESWLGFGRVPLSDDEKILLKIADCLELLLYSRYRLTVGDQFFKLVEVRILDYLYKIKWPLNSHTAIMEVISVQFP